MKKKKILFIVSSLKVGGGAEKSVTLLAKGLNEYYDVEILTFYDFKEEYGYNVKRHSFGYKYSENLIKKSNRLLFIFPLKLRNFFKKNKYDLVISNAEDANLVSLMCKKFFYKFRLWTVIRNDIMDPKNIYYRFRRFQKWADKNIFISKSLEFKFISQIPKSNTKTIYNGFDSKEIVDKLKDELEDSVILNRIKNKKVLITIGRLVEQKNYFLLLETFASLCKKYSNLMLIIIGDGPLKQEIISKSKELRIYEKIILIPQTLNVYKFLRKSDVFVFTSNYEGFGRVLIEAMGVGLPVVSNNCSSGPSEIIHNCLKNEFSSKKYIRGEFGYLVPFNSKIEFVKAIEDALKNGKKFYRNKSFKRAKDFELNSVLEEWVREIEKI